MTASWDPITARIVRGTIAVLACVSLSSCAERFDLSRTSLRVLSVSFGTRLDSDGFLADPRISFTPSDRHLYTVVVLTGVHRETEVVGSWTYLPLQQEFTRSVVFASPLREVARFEVSSQVPWPEGSYLFTVRVSSGEETVTQTATFDVRSAS